MEETLESVGSRMRELRIKAGLTQKELAIPRYSHAYVSTVESGKRVPSESAVAFFAEKLEVSPEELSTGKPPDLEVGMRIALADVRRRIFGGEYHRTEAELKQLRADTQRFKLAKLEARTLETLAMLAERKGSTRRALDLYREAQELLAEAPLTEQVEAIVGEARCSHAVGDVRFAIHRLESLKLELTRSGLNDPNSLIRIDASLVASYFEAGLYAQAATVAEEALILAPTASDPERLAGMHMNVAWSLFNEGRPDEASASLERACDLYMQLEYPTETARARLAGAMVHARQGKVDEAVEGLQAARQMFEDSADWTNFARATNELARLLRLSERREEAAGLLEESLDNLSPEAHPSLYAWAVRERALTQLGEDDDEAEKNLRRAIELFGRTDEVVELASTYRALGDLLSHKGEESMSADAYRSGVVALERRL